MSPSTSPDPREWEGLSERWPAHLQRAMGSCLRLACTLLGAEESAIARPGGPCLWTSHDQAEPRQPLDQSDGLILDMERLRWTLHLWPQAAKGRPGQERILADLSVQLSALLRAAQDAWELRIQQARVRTAIRAGTDWLWESDAQGRITWVTDSVSTHSGWPAERDLHQDLNSLYQRAPAPFTEQADTWSRALKQQSAFQEVVLIRKTAHGPLHVALSGHPVFDSQLRFMGYRGTARDLTRTLHERAQAHARERLLDLSLKGLDHPLIMVDDAGALLFANPAWHAFTQHWWPGAEGAGDDWPAMVRRLSQTASGLNEVQRERMAALLLQPRGDRSRQFELTLQHRCWSWNTHPLDGGRVMHMVRDISAHKRTQQALLKNAQVLSVAEAKSRAILAALPDAWVVMSSSLQCVDACSAWLERAARDTTPLIGQAPEAWLPEASADTLRMAAGTVLATGTPQRISLHRDAPEGGVVRYEARLSLMPNAAVLVLLRDLTAWEQLEQERELLARIVEAEASLPILICDARQADMPIIYANPSFERLTGYMATEAMGRNCRFLQGDDRDQPGSERMRDALAKGEACTVLMRNYRKDGQAFLNELHLTPVRDAEDQLTHYMAVLSDQTERHRQAEALRLSEERMRFALDGSELGVCDWDLASGVAYFSEGWKALSGQADAATVGRIDNFWDHVDTQDRAQVRAQVIEHLKGHSAVFEMEHRLRRTDHSLIWVRNRGKVVQRDPSGLALRWVGTLADITTQRESEALEEERRSLALVSKSKSEFLSRMSHEMRTPLNAVIGFADLLRQEPGIQRQQLREYAGHIFHAGQHLLDLTNDVLDLQQTESGHLSLELQSVPLREALSHGWAMLAPLAARRRVRHALEVPEGAAAWADRRRLQQVLMNLLSNAIKYNREGGWVRLRAEQDASHWHLWVEDQGPGFRREDLKRLYQPFERLGKETSGIEGTGLGLLITRSLLQAMGGEILIDSETGGGARIRISLPVSPEGAAVPKLVPHGQGQTCAPADPIPQPPLRVLLVDDNPISALLLRESLQVFACVDWTEASELDAACAAAASQAFDLWVVDGQRSDVSPAELLAMLSSAAAVPTPAIVIGADEHEARRPGDLHWPRPLDMALMRTEFMAWLARHQAHACVRLPQGESAS